MSSHSSTKPRPWPEAGQFNEAVQNLASSMSDPELQAGEPQLSPLGVPMPYSGGFADVYKVHCPATGNTWALKFFKHEVRGQHQRYQAISEHLSRVQLGVMVDFRYLDQGVRISGHWYPMVKMRWIEGLSLKQFVGQTLERPRRLQQLFELWAKLSELLRKSQIAHADLQHGNVILVPQGDRGRLQLKLVDYDGMYLPSLARHRSGELGHPNYQHPQRLVEEIYGPDLDRFSHLVICCALRCLSLRGGNALWNRFHTGENLLFTQQDFVEPAQSELFRELWRLEDPQARTLVAQLVLASQRPLDETPLLEEIVRDGVVVPPDSHLLRAAEAILQPYYRFHDEEPTTERIDEPPVVDLDANRRTRDELPWPEPAQINESVQNLLETAADPEVRTGETELGVLGVPLPSSGMYSDVYKVRKARSSQAFAVKIFTRNMPQLRQRYDVIREHLTHQRLPSLLPFRFLDAGLRIGDAWYPVLKMDWAEGAPLNQFVQDHLDDPVRLRRVFDEWVNVSRELAAADVAHGDLQHGNVLVSQDLTTDLRLQLIDYDGMYVPALNGLPRYESGHPNYQHPRPGFGEKYSPQLDRFAQLTIACTLRCLCVGGRWLWDRYNAGDNLLFTARDLADPAASELFHDLWALPDPECHALAWHLALATLHPLREIEPLYQRLRGGAVRPLTPSEQQVAAGMLAGEMTPPGTLNAELPFQVPLQLPPQFPHLPEHHQEPIHSKSPTFILLLVDQSASMATPLAGNTAITRAQRAADVANKLLQELVYACMAGSGIRNLYSIGLITYGEGITLGFGGELKGALQPLVSDVASYPLRLEERTQLVDNGEGGMIERIIRFPIWVDPAAGGKTRLRAVLETAADDVADFVRDFPESYPPIVIHVSGGPGNLTDAQQQEIESAAQSLRSHANRNGSQALLFHVYLSDVTEAVTVFPSDEWELPDAARLLFRISSPLTDEMWRYSNMFLERSFSSGARGIVSGPADTLAKLLTALLPSSERAGGMVSQRLYRERR